MFEKIRDIISEQLNIDPSEIREDSSFKDDLEADSLDLVELIMAIEEECGIEVGTDELENVATVKDIMDYLATKGVEL